MLVGSNTKIPRVSSDFILGSVTRIVFPSNEGMSRIAAYPTSTTFPFFENPSPLITISVPSRAFVGRIVEILGAGTAAPLPANTSFCVSVSGETAPPCADIFSETTGAYAPLSVNTLSNSSPSAIPSPSVSSFAASKPRRVSFQSGMPSASVSFCMARLSAKMLCSSDSGVSAGVFTAAAKPNGLFFRLLSAFPFPVFRAVISMNPRAPRSKARMAPERAIFFIFCSVTVLSLYRGKRPIIHICHTLRSTPRNLI